MYRLYFFAIMLITTLPLNFITTPNFSSTCSPLLVRSSGSAYNEL